MSPRRAAFWGIPLVGVLLSALFLYLRTHPERQEEDLPPVSPLPRTEKTAPRSDAGVRTDLPATPGLAQSLPGRPDPASATSRREVESLYYRVVAVTKIRSTLSRAEYDKRLCEIGAELTRALGRHGEPTLLELLQETQDEELGIAVLRSLVSLHDEGDPDYPLFHLTGSGGGVSKPFGPALAQALLALAESRNVPLSLRAGILENLDWRLNYDPALFGDLKRFADQENSDLIRARLFTVMSGLRGKFSPADAQSLFTMARKELSNGSPEIRAAAASALRDDPKSVEELLSAVSFERTAEVKEDVLMALLWNRQGQEFPEEAKNRVAHCVLDCMRDPDQRISNRALSYAGKVATPATAPDIFRALDYVLTTRTTGVDCVQAVESLSDLAASGFLKEAIRSRMEELSQDPGISNRLRTACIACAKGISK